MAFIGRGSISAEMEARAAKRLAQTLVIDKLPRAQARHDAASRVGANPCFRGTREAILEEISTWLDDPSAPPIFWLSGMAGVGKSTIAHTIAEQEDRKHRLGASFFFSRDEADRRNPHLVYPTIAFQLAGFDSSLREPITQALEQDADLGHSVMKRQFEQLIAGPLEKFKGTTRTILFVLDALDECSPASGAIEILARWAFELPKISNRVGVMLRVLVTSRPELHIHDQFQLSALRLISQSFVLHDIEKSVVKADIQLFLTGRLADLAILHRVAQPWPTASEISALASSSENLFILASTTVNFIGGAKGGRSLQHRLDQILRPDSSMQTSAFAQLDALYLCVLEAAENDLEETLPCAKATFRLVLETIVLLLDPLPPTSLAGLLSLHPDDVLTFLQDLRSILVIPASSDSAEPVRFFHPSFYDFITTPGRQSGSFFIPTTSGHTRLAKLCLKTMHMLLRKDPCSVGNPWSFNMDITDLQKRLERAAPNQLRYSCRFFCLHISLSAPGDESLEQLLESFCKSNLLTWLEMMSLLGDVDGAINSIQLLTSWCHNSSTVKKTTADLVHDAYRVLLQYQSPLRLSAGHLYSTVLSFAPVCSLTKQYASQLHVPYVLRGRPAKWDANLITADSQGSLLALTFFPDGTRIATGDNCGRISVWSSSTGAEVFSIGPQDDFVRQCHLDISGDGSRIASLVKSWTELQLNVWDASTGSCIWRLRVPDPGESKGSIAFSADGQKLLYLSSYGAFVRLNSATGSILSGHRLPVERAGCRGISNCGSVVAIQDDKSLKIWEVSEDETITLIQPLLPDYLQTNDIRIKQIFLLHNQRILALSSSDRLDHAPTTVTLWDYQSGLEFIRITLPQYAKAVAICKENKRLAIGNLNAPMEIWDLETGILSVQLAAYTSTRICAAAFSPTEMIIASVDNSSAVRTWNISAIHSRVNLSNSETDMGSCGSVSASRSGNDVITTYSGSKLVRIWNISARTCLELNVPKLGGSAKMSPNGLYFVCCTTDGWLGLGWDLFETRSLQCLYSWSPAGELSNSFAVFSEDSRLIAVTGGESWDEVLEVLDIHRREKLWAVKIGSMISGIAFLPNGTSLLAVDVGGYEIIDITGNTDRKSFPRSELDPENLIFLKLGGIFPDGSQFLLIGPARDSARSSYAVNINDSAHITEYVESSHVFQIFETLSGHEIIFLVHDQVGHLYKRGKDFRQFLCWLPPAWRFMNGKIPAVWRGSYLIIGLYNGEIGVIDVDALSCDGLR